MHDIAIATLDSFVLATSVSPVVLGFGMAVNLGSSAVTVGWGYTGRVFTFKMNQKSFSHESLNCLSFRTDVFDDCPAQQLHHHSIQQTVRYVVDQFLLFHSVFPMRRIARSRFLFGKFIHQVALIEI